MVSVAPAPVDWQEIERAGLLGPDDRASRRALLQFLIDLGAGTEELVAAAERGNLHGLGADLLLSRGPLSGADVAERIGMSWDELASVLHHLGIVVDGPGERRFDDADLELLALLVDPAWERFGGAREELLRVLGASISRIAEAGVASFVQDVEAGMAAEGADSVELARVVRETAEITVGIGRHIGALLRHHLWSAISRQRRRSSTDPSRALMQVGVGFVDLVGFTPLSRRLDPTQLVALLNEFDECAHHCITTGGGHVVKHLGDEVMFVADDAPTACRLARRFMGRFADRSGVQPRGGVAAGEVLFRHGDYYGPVVNLAARLVAEAVPGELLVDELTASEAPDLGFEPAGRRELKGFDEPVRVHALTAGGAVGD